MFDNLGELKRTHTCGCLTGKNSGENVVLMGWVNKRRDLGGLIFIDLRDFHGKTQIVIDPNAGEELYKKADSVRPEYVIAVSGKVSLRPDGMKNNDMHTGEIEISAENILVLNSSETPPFEIVNDTKDVSEDLRLKYRYLDLRSERMKKNIKTRMEVKKVFREHLTEQGFNELETPMLIKSTPEGARDYLVPARLYPGQFYALPQSPQLYKQLYMVAGFDKYFQFARCFRDEDSRGDRQPEHTQVDIEMSFATEENIYALIEGMMSKMFERVMGQKLEVPFERMSYDEAMDRYGSDKPDVRFGMELKNASEIVKNSEFSVFSNTIANEGQVKFITVKGGAKYSRKDISSFENDAKKLGAQGLAWMKYTEGAFTGGISKFLNDSELNSIKELGNVEENDIVFFVADKAKVVAKALGFLRNDIAKKEQLYDPKEFAFLWVNSFPLFEWNEDEEKWEACHHMFTMPQEEFIDTMEENPGAVKGQLYDLVCNGVRISVGKYQDPSK